MRQRCKGLVRIPSEVVAIAPRPNSVDGLITYDVILVLKQRDLQQTFGFPDGNIEHTLLVNGQSYDGREYAEDAELHFY